MPCSAFNPDVIAKRPGTVWLSFQFMSQDYTVHAVLSENTPCPPCPLSPAIMDLQKMPSHAAPGMKDFTMDYSSSKLFSSFTQLLKPVTHTTALHKLPAPLITPLTTSANHSFVLIPLSCKLPGNCPHAHFTLLRN